MLGELPAELAVGVLGVDEEKIRGLDGLLENIALHEYPVDALFLGDALREVDVRTPAKIVGDHPARLAGHESESGDHIAHAHLGDV